VSDSFLMSAMMNFWRIEIVCVLGGVVWWFGLSLAWCCLFLMHQFSRPSTVVHSKPHVLKVLYLLPNMYV
jgi:hypothetical protein